MKRLYFIFLLFFLVSSPLSANPVEEETPPQNQFESSTGSTETTHCPSVEKIMHDPKTQLWGIGDWVSSEPSYDKRIVSFQAAQWVGTQMGTMICVYKSDNPTSFPITIQNTTLIPSPTGPNWGSYENGRKNCPSYPSENPVDVNDCPFLMPKKTTNPQNIYEELNFFKNKPAAE